MNGFKFQPFKSKISMTPVPHPAHHPLKWPVILTFLSFDGHCPYDLRHSKSWCGEKTDGI